MTVRFLHAADLHLGLRLARFDKTAAAQIAEARFVALDNLKKAAAEHRVDFTLIAGDIFDDNAVPSALAERAFAVLESPHWPGPVLMIPGNHDPLTPGCVWDRDPWLREQPNQRVCLLRRPEPYRVPGVPATIFPCPLTHKNSIDDPTAWIANFPRQPADGVRIGLAHGSLRILPQLPEDDHLIPANAADRWQLDYLALGHWHQPLLHAGRTAYPGTHEPFRFPAESTGDSIGWQAYAADGTADRFADDGRGVALLVEIPGPEAPPKIQELNIGHLRWLAECRDLTGLSPGRLASELSNRPNTERTLLKLRLTGVLSPQEHRRLHELHDIVHGRYRAGSSLDAADVRIEPNPDELAAAIGPGVLARVVDRLRQEAEDAEPTRQRIAQHALQHLFQILWEDRPA